jgi:hypothetical protein
MRIRHLIEQSNVLSSDTEWSTRDLPPRHAPIYSRSRPMRAGWKWRSALAIAAESKFILTVLCNPARDNWQALLILDATGGASVIARFEHHGGHAGIHGHAHCDRGGIEVGASSMDDLVRTPKSGQYHRRTNAWTERTFWEAAKRFFRITEGIGPLFDHAP